MKSVIVAVCLMLGVAPLAGAAENPFVQFNADVETAYAAYRKALFQTNRNDAEKSAEANDSFIRQWQQIRQAYGSNPPQIFSSDLKWEATLSAVEEIARNSADQITQGKLAEAHDTLEAIRDELTELRKRNSVIVFSDHINNYHSVMEALLTGGFTPDRIDDRALSEIQGQLAVLNYLAVAIRENAPAAYQGNQQYQQLEKELFESLAALAKAVESRDPASISKSINMLKPAYAKLFVNFG